MTYTRIMRSYTQMKTHQIILKTATQLEILMPRTKKYLPLRRKNIEVLEVPTIVKRTRRPPAYLNDYDFEYVCLL